MDIRLFLWTHPWWHAAAVLVPPVVLGAILSLRELHHSKEANRLRREANDFQNEANGLREQANNFYEDANRFRAEANRLGEEAARANEQANQSREEANRLREQAKNAVVRIADNTTKTPTLADRNAAKLRKYIGKTAKVSEGSGGWGTPPEIVEVNEDNIVTLFTPAGYSSTSAFAICVHCEQLQIVEEPTLQIRVLQRYGDPIQLGEIKRWQDKGAPSSGKPLPRGRSVFNANYSLPGSSQRRGINIYAPADGNPQYTLVTLIDGQETDVLYGSNVEISKKFAILQIDWRAEGYQYGGGGTGGSPERLFLFTN
jgi:hypothetical protein